LGWITECAYGEELANNGYQPAPLHAARKQLGVMIWGCITFNGLDTLDFLEGSINALKYTDILTEKQSAASGRSPFSHKTTVSFKTTMHQFIELEKLWSNA